MLSNTDKKFLDAAYEEALKGLGQGGIPIGAVLVIDGNIVSRGHNKRIQELSMIKHGEMDCFENTKRQLTPEQLQRSTLYTTLSPCQMCAGTAILYKVKKVVIGENQTFEASEQWLQDQGIEVVVANDRKFIELMNTFIRSNPKLWGEDIGLTEAQVLEAYPESA